MQAQFLQMQIASLREQFLEAQGRKDEDKAREISRQIITIRARLGSIRRQNWYSTRKLA